MQLNILKQKKEIDLEEELTAETIPDMEKEPAEMTPVEFARWRIRETDRINRKKQKLRKVRRQIEQERSTLELLRQNFEHWQQLELTRQKNEERMLEAKREILEKELYKLAEEKRLFEQKRKFYEQVDIYQNTRDSQMRKTAVIRGELFFAGVSNAASLKKRFKDLQKIYHPDNKYGDTDTIQEINREYQRLSEQLIR